MSRRRAAAVAGHSGDEATARALLADPSPGVRATALGALARMGAATDDDVSAALADPVGQVRRRACEVAVGHIAVDLRPLLADADPMVVEAGAWALGERGSHALAAADDLGDDPAAKPQGGAGGPSPDAVEELVTVAGGHDDPLCREAAVAALGAIGDLRGLPAILAATSDKPAVRRRAVIALAPFDGPEVDAAMARALRDRDWQVRQAAEDLGD
ncbi:MAG TPA: HEAT repeat domain-containing protein [Acidimicrobiales bacterium]|nr:HEAT repeat domain-containing protein [Acidimicrobiales bacterium]